MYLRIFMEMTTVPFNERFKLICKTTIKYDKN